MCQWHQPLLDQPMPGDAFWVAGEVDFHALHDCASKTMKRAPPLSGISRPLRAVRAVPA
jgi:hypothetical protein